NRLYRRQSALRGRVVRHAEQQDQACYRCCESLHCLPLLLPQPPPGTGFAVHVAFVSRYLSLLLVPRCFSELCQRRSSTSFVTRVVLAHVQAHGPRHDILCVVRLVRSETPVNSQIPAI